MISNSRSHRELVRGIMTTSLRCSRCFLVAGRSQVCLIWSLDTSSPMLIFRFFRFSVEAGMSVYTVAAESKLTLEGVAGWTCTANSGMPGEISAGASYRAALTELVVPKRSGEKSGTLLWEGETDGCFLELGNRCNCCDRLPEDCCDSWRELLGCSPSPSWMGSIVCSLLSRLVSTKHVINPKFDLTWQFPFAICLECPAHIFIVRKFISKASNGWVGANRCTNMSKSTMACKIDLNKMTHSNSLSFPSSSRNAPCTKKTTSPCCPQFQPINPLSAFRTSSAIWFWFLHPSLHTFFCLDECTHPKIIDLSGPPISSLFRVSAFVMNTRFWLSSKLLNISLRTLLYCETWNLGLSPSLVWSPERFKTSFLTASFCSSPKASSPLIARGRFGEGVKVATSVCNLRRWLINHRHIFYAFL